MLSWIGRLFFKCPVGDFHCGLRGFRKDAIERLDLRTTGMEFASEMVVKASLFNLRATETPTVLAPDGRDRAPLSHLARRLATSEVPAALQSAMAVSLSWSGAVCVRISARWMASARSATYRRVRTRRTHASFCRDDSPHRISISQLCGVQ